MALVVGFVPDRFLAPDGLCEGEGVPLLLRLKGEERKRAAKEGSYAFCFRLNDRLLCSDQRPVSTASVSGD